jgi:hypothetical protein
MATNNPNNAEPVPTASQFVVLPFLAALEGYLQADGKAPDFRMTMHRTMVRGGQQYLQQITNYVGNAQGGVGRVNHTRTGIIGAAYHTGKTWRTKRYAGEPALLKDLAADMKATDDKRPIDAVAKSYLAIPFSGVKKRTVLVLYADSPLLNRFADDELVGGFVSMCRGFAQLIRNLQAVPIGLVRNFPLIEAADSSGEPTLYGRIQECLDWIETPTVAPISSFNFESSAA